MIRIAVAWVTRELARRQGVQELEVELSDGSQAKAIHYTEGWKEAEQGERIWINTTAVELGLGTGGYHYVIAFADENGASEVLGAESPVVKSAGHMMKLRYTPLQRAVLSVEEPDSPHHELFRAGGTTLTDTPVLIGELHSMLPIAAAWLKHRAGKDRKPLKLVYVMSDGGALPISLSKLVLHLREQDCIQGTVTYGHAYGGDLEAMNKFTALLAAKHVMEADVIISTMGPGIAGTGTELGHTGVETGELVNAVNKLGGMPILIPRISFTDERSRHYGISHHTLSVLRHVVATPQELVFCAELEDCQRKFLLHQMQDNTNFHWVEGIKLEELNRAISMLATEVKTMGRSIADDPAFFLSVAAAAEAAYLRLH